MKEVKRYICETCGDLFTTEDGALRCEAHHVSHKGRLKSLEVIMSSMGVISSESPGSVTRKWSSLPLWIEVKDNIDGISGVYMHSKQWLRPR